MDFPLFWRAMQIKPKLSAGAKEMGETQGSVASNATRAVQDLRDAVAWHVHFARQFGGAHVESVQFFGQVFTWMNGDDCHKFS
jgi:hypothetical protein